jgi:hypothetical protein
VSYGGAHGRTTLEGREREHELGRLRLLWLKIKLELLQILADKAATQTKGGQSSDTDQRWSKQRHRPKVIKAATQTKGDQKQPQLVTRLCSHLTTDSLRETKIRTKTFALMKQTITKNV